MVIQSTPDRAAARSGESREAEANGLRPGQSDGGDSRIWNIIDFGIVMLGVLDQWVAAGSRNTPSCSKLPSRKVDEARAWRRAFRRF